MEERLSPPLWKPCHLKPNRVPDDNSGGVFIKLKMLDGLGMPLTNTVTSVQPGGKPLTAAEVYAVADQLVDRKNKV
jgi:hypothetical protein